MKPPRGAPGDVGELLKWGMKWAVVSGEDKWGWEVEEVELVEEEGPGLSRILPLSELGPVAASQGGR